MYTLICTQNTSKHIGTVYTSTGIYTLRDNGGSRKPPDCGTSVGQRKGHCRIVERMSLHRISGVGAHKRCGAAQQAWGKDPIPTDPLPILAPSLTSQARCWQEGFGIAIHIYVH